MMNCNFNGNKKKKTNLYDMSILSLKSSRKREPAKSLSEEVVFPSRRDSKSCDIWERARKATFQTQNWNVLYRYLTSSYAMLSIG